MEKICINGGKKLSGSVVVGGMKNAALPILFATILVEGECVIENMPVIEDMSVAYEIMRRMGAKVDVQSDGTTVKVDTGTINKCSMPHDLARKMRGSYYVLGAELGRFGCAAAASPGGCSIGSRLIDQHIKGFEAMGATFTEENDVYYCSSENGLHSANIYLDIPSVGATLNIMLAAVLTEGMTVIENAAREPHIVDLANFLSSCGANISGAGTEVIKIRGVEKLTAGTYAIIPDMIEAGTYMIAAAATDSRIEIKNVIPKHLESITAKLEEMGVSVTELDDSVIVDRAGAALKRVRVKTTFYPGFPTDMQPQICVLLCLADGQQSILTESVFDDRLKYTSELIRMGASITVNDNTATIDGQKSLHAAMVRALDLRAGVAMIIAGLATEGSTYIEDIHHIERGYENIIGKLQMLGADIKKVRITDIG